MKKKAECRINTFCAISLGVCLSAHALTNGPAMPEYNDFEPVDATDMVNLATGSFSYALPLLTVPGPGLGFPIVLSYHSGITPKQEATWVGLGWNVQAGSITRQVNKVPDDFRGEIMKESIKSSSIHGWMASVGYNGATVGVSWDNTHGYGGIVGLGIEVPGTPISAGMSRGWNGVYSGTRATIGLGIQGMGMLERLSINADSKGRGGLSLQGQGGFEVGIQSSGSAGISASMSLDAMDVSLGSKSGLGGSVRGSGSQGISVKGNTVSNSFMASLVLPTHKGVFSINWGSYSTWLSGYNEDRYYGFLYSDRTGMGCVDQDGQPNCVDWANANPDYFSVKSYKKQDFEEFSKDWEGPGSNTQHGRLANTAEDIYTVATQGLSGNFGPHRREDGDYLTSLGRFRETFTTDDCLIFEWLCTEGVMEVNRPKMLDARRNYLNHGQSSSDVYWRFSDDLGGGEYTNPYEQRNVGATASGRSKKIQPYFLDDRLVGFEITKEDGVRYVYGFVVNAFNEQKIGTHKTDVNIFTKQESNAKYAYAWLLTSIQSVDYVMVGSGHACRETSVGQALCDPRAGDIGGWVKFTYGNGYDAGSIIYSRWETPFVDEAYLDEPTNTPSWSHVLTGQITSQNQVKYGPTPLGKVDKEGSTLLTSRSGARGEKEIAYLMAIETPTHKAEFQLSDRGDARVNETSYSIPVPQRDISKQVLEAIQYSCNQFYGYCESQNLTVEHRERRRQFTVKTRLPVGQQVTVSGTVTRWKHSGVTCGNGQWCELVSEDLPAGPYTVQKVGADNLIVFEHTMALDRLIEGSPTLEQNQDIPISLNIATLQSPNLRKLDRIVLKNSTFNSTIATTEFNYDYSLSPMTPNGNPDFQYGKLTLLSVRTGAGPTGPWMPPHRFEYHDPNQPFQTSTGVVSSGGWLPYERFQWDRWGYRCTSCDDSWHETSSEDVLAWNLSKIKLPSGGSFEIAYEPNEIRYVGKEDYFRPVSGSSRKILPLNQLEDAEISQGSPFISNTKNLAGSSQWTLHAYEASYKVIDVGSITLGGACPGGVPPNSCTDIGIKFPDGSTQDVQEGQSYTNKYLASGFPEIRMELAPRCMNDLDGNSRLCNTTIKLSKIKLAAEIDPPSSHSANGGGVRVASLRKTDPYSEKVHSILYAYEGGTTPTLPPSFSDYDDSRYPSGMGYESFVGGPSVMYEKVTTTFEGEGYVSSYHFITPRHLPVYFGEIKSNLTTVGVDNQIAVNDLSSLWGQQWKQEDFHEGSVIKKEMKKWAINSEWQISYNELIAPDKPFSINPIEGGPKNILVDGEPVIEEHEVNSGLPYIVGSDDQKHAFGLHFTLFGHVYYWNNCAGEDQTSAACHESKIKSTRILKRKHLAHVSEAKVIQDGLDAATRSYRFDFRSGAALNTWNRNSDGSIHVTASVPAYTMHPAMLTANMLTQQYSNTTYHYPSVNGADIPFIPGTDDEVAANVVSSNYTLWRPFSSGIGTNWVYRKAEEYAWRNSEAFGAITNFAQPNDYCAATAGQNPDGTWENCSENTIYPGNWVSKGKTLRYDKYGHPIEFQDSHGVKYSQIFGHGDEVPIAHIQNAGHEGLFAESFELRSEYEMKMTGIRSDQEMTSVSKSGTRSLALVENGNSLIHESACFNIGTMKGGVPYVASAWYFDDQLPFSGGQSVDPNFFHSPGISLGVPGACYKEQLTHIANGSGQIFVSNPEFAASGSGTWRKVDVRLECPSDQPSSLVCIYKHKGVDGTTLNTQFNQQKLVYDELRVHPEKAFMSTYTYDARGKMTSSSDVRGTTTFYSYDPLGNLSRIKNDDGITVSEKAKQYSRRR